MKFFAVAVLVAIIGMLSVEAAPQIPPVAGAGGLGSILSNVTGLLGNATGTVESIPESLTGLLGGGGLPIPAL